MIRMLHHEPALSELFMTYRLSRNIRIEEDLVDQLFNSVGTTQSRVSFFMNKFRKLGFVDYNGGLQIHSSLLSVVLHD
jgi:CRP/FNR family transcriptional regulator, cyclic AMP receptor protein